jgi:T-complex protein 1 subunit beta
MVSLYPAALQRLTPLICHQSYQNPTQIFAEDVTEEKGENARLSAFVGAIAVGDLVKSTLGPKGMDKILQSAYVPFADYLDLH